ncbi:MAG: CoA ester lyase [Rhodoferax sp.]|jgi:citrate lyase subunit beta/citryl-CoA lyase|nr:CoA ester lyase [Rhodoferax sp.]
MAAQAVTWLFVPATRPERLAKAFAAGAHAVIADLEDAVDACDKDHARTQLETVLQAGCPPPWVRINGVGTPWFAQDLALVHSHRSALAGVVLAKTDSAADLQALDVDLPVLGLIESARGMLALAEICRHPRITRLAFGAADLSADLGCEDDWDLLWPARLQLLTHCAAAGLPPPVDGVTMALQDPALVKGDARRAARAGFGAKLCIHPAQLAPVLSGFAPTQAQLQWAQRIMALAQQAGSGAQRVDGQMVDRPVIARAQQILQRASLRANP